MHQRQALNNWHSPCKCKSLKILSTYTKPISDLLTAPASHKASISNQVSLLASFDARSESEDGRQCRAIVNIIHGLWKLVLLHGVALSGEDSLRSVSSGMLWQRASGECLDIKREWENRERERERDTFSEVIAGQSRLIKDQWQIEEIEEWGD